MGDGNSLINLGELSKPATVLIEKISDATGALFEPYQIKRLAKAEVEADKIRALGKIELSSLEQRAMRRLVTEETKKQENIENITAKAVKGLKEDAKPENLERDWIANFFDKCRLVSDEEMQSLWSRLLTGEANEPGTFSKRTVELVANLDKGDAHLFTKLIGFGWELDERLHPLIYDHMNGIYFQQDINFISLNHLETIGLIKFSSVKGFIKNNCKRYTKLFYFDKSVVVKFGEEDNNILNLGSAILTQAGIELAPICGASSHPENFEYVLNVWDKLDYDYSCE